MRASRPAEAALPYRPRACTLRGRGRVRIRPALTAAPSDPAAVEGALGVLGALAAPAAPAAVPVAADKSDAKWSTTTTKVTTTAAFSSIGQVAAPLSGHLLAGLGSLAVRGQLFFIFLFLV